ncbi:septum formation initiator family protein [Adlercreutzia sp. R25]|uniref:Septum formation initiator family protein n=1 Tax=Adlercreutzia shanghongiae TaxID=3111773 RepID=A0ABU6IZX5_9ACTN|nr:MULTISPECIES: septum formation initiator family protein [unclassified Adlercreutzia]MEC4273152.1 septum formation initiator family protein [Adlercreutzia sp. R25]MEC4295364.1 septum formation initiator family protein [Adlercreutzia sp. R22]
MPRQANIVSFDAARRAASGRRGSAGAAPSRRHTMDGAGFARQGSASGGRTHAGRFADDPDFEVAVTSRPRGSRRTAPAGRTAGAGGGATANSRAAASNRAAAGRSSTRSAAPYAPLSVRDAHRGPSSLESRGALRGVEPDDTELDAPLGPVGRLTSKFGKKRRQRAKERAGRAYYQQYEAGKPSEASQGGPRAAVYKGEMGASHKRSSRMQQKSSARSERFKAPSDKRPFFTRAPFVVACATALCLAFGAVFLYAPAQQLYIDIRERDRLAAEYAAVVDRNAAIEAQVNALSTDAGIEDAARTQLGWVREGEHAVSVGGLAEAEEASAFRGNIVSEDIVAADTWYSDLLDPIFGVE